MTRWIALAASLLCSACYTGPPTDVGEVGNGIPDGVIVADAASARASGLYVTSPSDATNCCWIARTARFRTEIPARARRLRVTVDLPEAGPYDRRPVDVTIAVGAHDRKRFTGLRSGVYALDVALARASLARVETVAIATSYTWSPAELHVSGDSRSLSVMVRSVRAE